MNRYQLNIGVYLSSKKLSKPVEEYKSLIDNISYQNYPTFSKGSNCFKEIEQFKIPIDDNSQNSFLMSMLDKDIKILDISEWTKKQLSSHGYNTVRSVITAEQSEFKKIHMVGNVRSVRIINSALNAIIEYLSN